MLGLERLAVQSRLIVLLLAVSLGSILAIGWIGYRSARDSITYAVQQQLQSVRHSKTTALVDTLKGLRDQVLSISDGRLATDGMAGFRRGMAGLQDASLEPEQEEKLRRWYAEEFIPELKSHLGGAPMVEQYLPAEPRQRYLQYHYLLPEQRRLVTGDKDVLPPADLDDSEYGIVHKAVRDRMERAATLFGYEDILLIDDDTLEIVYSLKKRPDFATSLRAGRYAGTSLARAAASLALARDKDSYRVADIEAYVPDAGLPVGFVLSPIFNGPEMIGILALEFPVDRIVAITTGRFEWEREGMGKTGECYLVGPDLMMRSRSRFMVEDQEGFMASLRRSSLPSTTVDQIERQGNVINQLPVRTPAAEDAIRGREGLTIITDYRGVLVLSSYGPLDLDSIRWGVIAEMDVEEAYAPIRSYARHALLAATGLSLGTAILALVASWLLVRPLRQLTEAARRIGAGEVGVRVDLNSRDEFGDLARTFNQMSESLREQRSELEAKARENQELLLNILPAAAVAQRRDGDEKATRQFADVTVLVAEFVGLDSVSGPGSERAAMDFVSDLIAACDEATERCGVEKVRAVGSAYLAVCGLSLPRPDHAARTVQFGRDLCRIVAQFNSLHGTALSVSVGVNSGPIVGGVVGRQKFLYDLWGDTVAIASRLAAQNGQAVVVTDPVHDRLVDLYAFAGPVDVEVRGNGTVRTWALQDRGTP
ncbi:MAG: HAMP domain-containing protein [Planctomycetota bacterium]|nr:MAG: HAMP domain-containing protein [Planctomycetota bacterium]